MALGAPQANAPNGSTPCRFAPPKCPVLFTGTAHFPMLGSHVARTHYHDQNEKMLLRGGSVVSVLNSAT